MKLWAGKTSLQTTTISQAVVEECLNPGSGHRVGEEGIAMGDFVEIG